MISSVECSPWRRRLPVYSSSSATSTIFRRSIKRDFTKSRGHGSTRRYLSFGIQSEPTLFRISPPPLNTTFRIHERQVAIPCRPAKTFTVYVLDVPEELPEEDIRHALYKYRSIVEVTRLPLNTATVRKYLFLDIARCWRWPRWCFKDWSNWPRLVHLYVT